VTGSDDDKRRAFAAAFVALKARLDRLLVEPAGKINRETLNRIARE
jgi:hypothetical protein